MLPRLHWTCFSKKCTSKKSSKEKSIILQFHPLSIIKIYFPSLGPAWHWVKKFRCPTRLLLFPITLDISLSLSCSQSFLQSVRQLLPQNTFEVGKCKTRWLMLMHFANYKMLYKFLSYNKNSSEFLCAGLDIQTHLL